jgi:hypothetical protein
MTKDPHGAAEVSQQAGAAAPQPTQMEASQPRKSPRVVQAAFGTSSGAAMTFRDYASI